MAQARTGRRELPTWARWVIGILAVIGVIVLVGFANFRRATIAPQPGAFYTPPDPLPAGPPGTLIRSEPMPEDLPEGAIAYRIMYLSTDLNGAPIAVSGTVVAPAAPSAAPRDVVAWAHGTVGILPECNVSHTSEPYKQTPAVAEMLAAGFVIVATDYPGLSTPGIHPYLVGRVAAYSVLDSVRAARQLADINAGERFVVWGASQGGNSSLWTAHLAPEYAPELNLVAAAAAAPAIDPAGIISTKIDDVGGGVVTAEAFYAWSYHYPDANLDDIIIPEQREQFERIARTCLSTPAAYLTLGGLLTPSQYLSVNVLETEPWRTIMDENASRGRVAVPVLITHGTADTLIDISLTETDVARRCAEGEQVQFMRLAGVGHDARNESGPLTVGWLIDRFAGRPMGTTCG